MNSAFYSIEEAREKLLCWANQFESFALLDNHDFLTCPQNETFGDFALILAAGTGDELLPTSTPFDSLCQFVKGRHAFGYLTYDLKNATERLTSNNFDGLGFPDLHFFVPNHLFVVDKKCKLHILESSLTEEKIGKELNTTSFEPKPRPQLSLKRRIEKEEYIDSVNKIKEHISKGDIYEMNFCQEFYANDAAIDPISTYLNLAKVSPTPFACFYKLGERFLISASPERFIKKMGNRVISQPIKGTIRRGRTPQEDELLKNELRNNPKELAENVMIVDLVRNDLSKTAKDGSVNATKLFGIYPFKQVFQMISTIESEVDEKYSGVDVIREAFPMGSMTGAPKIAAMRLIEEYEKTKRGLYSGAVGYFTPSGDFDFNVIIRSILYNKQNHYLSFSVGSAITFGSEPEKEYEECLVKAKAIIQVLEGKL